MIQVFFKFKVNYSKFPNYLTTFLNAQLFYKTNVFFSFKSIWMLVVNQNCCKKDYTYKNVLNTSNIKKKIKFNIKFKDPVFLS